jgi:hypothetical protein
MLVQVPDLEAALGPSLFFTPNSSSMHFPRIHQEGPAVASPVLLWRFCSCSLQSDFTGRGSYGRPQPLCAEYPHFHVCFTKKISKLGKVVQPIILALRRPRQKDLESAWATQQNPVPKQTEITPMLGLAPVAPGLLSTFKAQPLHPSSRVHFYYGTLAGPVLSPWRPPSPPAPGTVCPTSRFMVSACRESARTSTVPQIPSITARQHESVFTVQVLCVRLHQK